MRQVALSDLAGLKGAKLSILVCLVLAPGGVSQEFIERTINFTDKPVSQALMWLSENQFIVESSGGWRLADGFQLALPMSSSALPMPVSVRTETDDCPTASRNNSDSVNDDSLSSGENLDESSLISESRKVSESEAALASYGIVINDRTRPLLALTVKEIGATVARARVAGWGVDKTTGYLVACLCGTLKTRRYVDNRPLNERYDQWNE